MLCFILISSLTIDFIITLLIKLSSVENTSLNHKHRLHDYYTDKIQGCCGTWVSVYSALHYVCLSYVFHISLDFACI